MEKWKVNCYLKSRLGEKSEFEDGISGTYGANCGKDMKVLKGYDKAQNEFLFLQIVSSHLLLSLVVVAACLSCLHLLQVPLEEDLCQLIQMVSQKKN